MTTGVTRRLANATAVWLTPPAETGSKSGRQCHSVRDEACDLFPRVACLPQNFDAVLAEPRRRAAVRRSAIPTTPSAPPCCAIAPFARMLDRREETGLAEVRVVEKTLERVERHHRDVGARERVQPFRARARADVVGDERVDLRDVLRARRRRGEARVLPERSLRREREEGAPLLVVVHEQAQIAVARRVRVAMLARAAARSPWTRAADRTSAGHVIAQDELREAFEHRDFDGLAFAGALAIEERGRDRVDGVEAGDAIGHRRRHEPRPVRARLADAA